MQYTLEWMEKKTTQTGKSYIKASLKDEQGKVTDNVSIWSDFPNYANLALGGSITGELKTNDKGYTNLYPPASTPNSGPSGGYKAKVINDAMEKKAGYISHAQENKEHGIKVSSTIRMAVDMAIAEGKPTAENIKDWRKWFWMNWDVSETDFPPF